MLTFTTTGDWETQAQGRMRKFWDDVRHTWVGTRYFCWAELTLKGQLHYHALWLNPPHQTRVHLTSWVRKHWGDDRAHVSFPHNNHVMTGALEYVKKYVHKMGRKRYQQRYEEMPREFRTFMTQRLEIPPGELLQHLERDIWEYVGESWYANEWIPAHLTCTGRWHHIITKPSGESCRVRSDQDLTSCSARLHRRRLRRPLWWHHPERAPGRRARANHPGRSRMYSNL
jgi:hypothetical protein